jgi:hypothetical protein
MRTNTRHARVVSSSSPREVLRRTGLRWCRLWVGLLACCVEQGWAQPVLISARVGEFMSRPLAGESLRNSVSGQLRFVKTQGTDAWPARASVGLFQGGAEATGVQVVLLQEKPSDTQMVVGYRVLEGGREFRFQPLDRVPTHTRIRFQMMLKRGAIALAMDGGEWQTIATPLRDARAYMTVSSGVAEFVPED